MGRFPRTPRTRCWYVHASVYGSWNRLCFCPVFHGTRAAPSTTGVGNFFSLVPVRPVLGTCTGPCTDRGIVCAFALFSMARVQLRPRRASGTFFHLSPYRPLRVLVWVRVRIVELSFLLPCFPWHACSSVHDGRRELFSLVSYHPLRVRVACDDGIDINRLCHFFSP